MNISDFSMNLQLTVISIPKLKQYTLVMGRYQNLRESQCGNFMILLSLRFYVKSFLVTFRLAKLPRFRFPAGMREN